MSWQCNLFQGLAPAQGWLLSNDQWRQGRRKVYLPKHSTDVVGSVLVSIHFFLSWVWLRLSSAIRLQPCLPARVLISGAGWGWQFPYRWSVNCARWCRGRIRSWGGCSGKWGVHAHEVEALVQLGFMCPLECMELKIRHFWETFRCRQRFIAELCAWGK